MTKSVAHRENPMFGVPGHARTPSSGRFALLSLLVSLAQTPRASAVEWIRPGLTTNRPLWGVRGGLLWAVAPAGFRPGESGWAGFSDLHPHRSSPYQLNCTARGPAMVEFECSDPWGHSKTLRLYGGSSWIEILLNEATSVYWDFDNPRNFAADGPTPGQWLFSDGQSGAVGREADGVPAQVKAPNTYWVIKHNADRLALGLVTPETATLHVAAPGAGAGGVGIEGSPPASHFVTFAGLLTASPAETMNGLQSTLNLQRPVAIRLHCLQARQ